MENQFYPKSWLVFQKWRNSLFLSKMKLKYVSLICIFFFGFEIGNVQADSLEAQQQQPTNETVKVTGTVTDNNGSPIPGLTVIEKGTRNGAITDADGSYTIEVSSDATLVFHFVGYLEEEVPVGNRRSIDVQMMEDILALEEIVVVGYGTQSAKKVIGAVSVIKNTEITTVKNENPQNMLTGKISGVRVVQKTSEPGVFNNVFDIRGFGNPLVIIDGVPRTNFTRMNAEDIESISVLKDASAAVYGVRAANGVVLITTKQGKGQEGLNLEYSGNYTWQHPSGSPTSVNAADWMTLANEKSMHNPNGGSLRFSLEEIEEYRNGTKPSTDWYDAIIRSGAPQTKHTLSASGGTEKTHFYTSVGYQYQESFFRGDNINYNRFNVRSNVSSQLTKSVKLGLNINGIADERSQPYTNTDRIIHSFQRANPTVPIYANNTAPFYQEGLVDGSNAVAQSSSELTGYRNFNNKWFQSSLTMDYAVPNVEGLSAKAMFSYDFQISDNKLFQRSYNQFKYDDAAETYNPITHQSPSQVRREFYTNKTGLYQLSMNYERVFTEKHHLNTLVLWEGIHRSGDNFYALRELSLDLDELFAGNSENQVANLNTNALYQDTNNGLVGRVGYDYAAKYLAEFSFRYDGSSKFAPGQQWGFFPVGLVGWRFSEENFWKNSALSVVNNAKLRASYGILGDDRASRFQFVSGYNYPASGVFDLLPGGHMFDGTFVNAASNIGIPNPMITWYTSRTFDVGLDVEAYDGVIGFTVDYFSRNRTGLLATRALSLPGVVGAGLPQENLNGDLTRGFELDINHKNRINDFFYNVKGIFSFTRTMNTYVERSESGNSYENWRGNPTNRYQGIWWGQGTNGRFTSYQDIANSPVFVNRGVLPGDYAYKDWNEDGLIDHLDLHPISYNGTPLVNLGLTINAEYKGFDLNLLFQGATMNYVVYNGSLREPMWGNANSNALTMFLDRWRPVDPTADPYDPNTEWVEGEFAYTGTTADMNSYFSINRGDYVRLKNVELGYRLPTSLIKGIGFSQVRFYVNSYNTLTFSRMKYIDPEHPSEAFGNVYPLNKTVTVGVNVQF